jgi:hypothetical protein
MNTPIDFSNNGPLVWAQPKALRREYQLKNGDELVGQLRFEKSYGSLATAEVASQNWTFKREGFLHPRVTVRVPNSEVNLAVFYASWSGGGVVEFPDGRQIRWRHASFWRSEWAFVQGEDRQLLLFKQHEGFLKISARLEIRSHRRRRAGPSPAGRARLVLDAPHRPGCRRSRIRCRH